MLEVRSEGGSPYAFKGRLEEIETLLNAVRMTEKGQRKNNEGMILIQGIPGVGKTALLEQVVARAKSPGVVHIEMDVEMLASDVDFLECIVEAGAPSANALRKLIVCMRRNLKGRLPGAEIGFSEPDYSSELFSTLRRTIGNGWWNNRIALITIDEIQSVDLSHKRLLGLLQRGMPNGIPAVVMCAGLAVSQRILRDIGVSPRLSTIINLDVLSDDEGRDAFHDGLKSLLQVGDHLEWLPRILKCLDIDEVVRDNANFPRHIQSSVSAIGSCINKFEKEDKPLDAREVMDAIESERNDYYASQLNLDIGIRALAEIARLLCASDGVLEEQINKCIHSIPDFGNEQPKVREILHALLYSGFLREVSGKYFSGIPSMNTYVLNRARGAS